MRVRYSFSSRKTGTIKGENQHKKAIPKVVKEVIDSSDIILEILDSRFINETRNMEIEEIIKEKNKKIIYILNKCDLASLAENITVSPHVLVSCKERRGIAELRNKISIEAKRLGKEKVTVGIIGYPNTGKSSLINALTGRSSAKSSKEAGFTKGMQKIRLKRNILLLDTPGLISENENSSINKADLIKHAKINVRTYDKVKEPEMIVHQLMKQYPQIFEKFYNIESEGDSEKLIEALGRRKNILKKGNQVDGDRTARLIIKDWQSGRIKV